MSRRKATTIIVIIIILVIITGALFFMSNKKGTGNPVADIQSGTISFRDFSPFNKPLPATENPAPTASIAPVVTLAQTPENGGAFTEPKVRKVTDFAVAGFTYFEKERPISSSTALGEDSGGGNSATATTATSTPSASPTPNPSPVGAGKKTPPAPTTEKVTALRYLQKQNAHIYDVFTDQKDAVQISDTTIPKIHDALFSPDGKSVILRYLNDATNAIETYSATVPAEPINNIFGDLKGIFLPEDIWWLSLSPDGTKMFALSSFGGGVVGDVSGLSGDKKVQVFSSAFNEWIPNWASKNTVTLATKASSNIHGYLYAVNTATKKTSRIMGNISGLTALMSPDEKHVLYAETTATAITMSIYDAGTHASKAVGLNTLPEKCVWSSGGLRAYCAVPKSWPDGSYPDSWYQGTVSFSDDIWEIDISGSLFSLTQLTQGADLSSESVDATHLKLDSAEHHLGFINKKDGTLWSIKL